MHVEVESVAKKEMLFCVLVVSTSLYSQGYMSYFALCFLSVVTETLQAGSSVENKLCSR